MKLALMLVLWGTGAAAQASAPPLIEATPVEPSDVGPPALERLPSKHERFKLVTPTPAGFHEVSRPQLGLALGGVGLFGACYLLSFVGGELNHSSWGGVPFVGAFGVAVDSSPGRRPFASGTGWGFMLAGLGQLGGATMAVLGLAVPQRWLERDRVAVRVTPAPGGVAVSGTFW